MDRDDLADVLEFGREVSCAPSLVPFEDMRGER